MKLEMMAEQASAADLGLVPAPATYGESLFPLVPVADPSLNLGMPTNQIYIDAQLEIDPKFIPQAPQVPVIEEVIIQKSVIERDTGSKEIGLIPGSKCEICPSETANFAVSKCNYSMKYFTGCGKPFCPEHGLGHFTTGMIDAEYLKQQRLKDLDMSESDIALSKVFNYERNQVGDDYKYVRLCKDCEDQFLLACKKQSCINLMWCILVIFVTYTILLVSLGMYG